MNSSILSAVKEKMNKTVDAVRNDFSRIQSGRASFTLLDGISVEYYGAKSPLNQVANISIPEARLIVIQPWDPTMINEILKSLQKADINISPVSDGKTIRLPIPQLTEDRRKDLVKQVKKELEDGKVGIRNIRRETNDTLKKDLKKGDISEDDEKRDVDQIQKLTDSFIKQLEGIADDKEKEIMTI